MADQPYQKIIDAAFTKKIDLLTADLYVVLVDTDHTGNRATDEFLTSIASGDRIGTAVQIPTAGRTLTGGVFTIPGPIAYGATDRSAQAMVIYSDTEDDGTSAETDGERRLVYWNDGKVPVIAAVGESAGATALRCEPLEDAIPSGTTFTIGGVSVTTNALAARDARSISVNATGGAIAIGSTGEASKGDGWPAPASPGGINLNFGGAPYGTFAIFP